MQHQVAYGQRYDLNISGLQPMVVMTEPQGSQSK